MGDELDEILGDFAVWDTCRQEDCEHYREYKHAKSAIRKHILQEALSLIGDDLPLDTEPNTGQRIHNKVKQELRNKFNDKYKED